MTQQDPNSFPVSPESDRQIPNEAVLLGLGVAAAFGLPASIGVSEAVCAATPDEKTACEQLTVAGTYLGILGIGIAVGAGVQRLQRRHR